ncbi:ABC transporter substrate-binding protein [Halobacteria archaeon AArc-curdl1]|uniref:ABC transporter substrate-binding protein n=1 Tax=Natronosalvus hydrolyticus TaxID=2979988 RepID=A0AAP2ZC24_9EURY|nr:ABC transporter substrate-binding protein [Halobacteria archaeon AArc-curdl1]
MDGPLQRRHLLASLGAAGSAALAGCSERLWSRAERTAPDRVSLEVKSVPTDDDRIAAMIANRLTENLRDAGIDTDQSAIDEAEFNREVLIDRDYDIFVMRHPGIDEPDSLRSLLHSDFVGEQGWQNPFSLSDPTVDDYLEAQLQLSADERRETFDSMFEYLIEEDTAPFTTVAHHDHIGAKRRILEISRLPTDAIGYLNALGTVTAQYANDDELEARDPPSIDVGFFGQQLVSRLNPLAVDLTSISLVFDLLYDPLYRRIKGEYVPWLAQTVRWKKENGQLEALVTLRDGLQWHDGELIDAADIAFTHRFLFDTSLGEGESPIPAPQYRGRQSLVDEVTIETDRTVSFSFGSLSQEVAQWAFTLPMLPEHIWRSRAEVIGEQRTEALAWDNPEPVGSGLFRFHDSTDNEFLDLHLFDEHRLLATGAPELLAQLAFDRSVLETEDGHAGKLQFEISPNVGSAIDALIEGDIDLVASEIPVDSRERLDESETIRPLTHSTGTFYMIGYNLRHPTLTNRRFRGAVSRLIDRDDVVETFFEGYATAAETHNSLNGVPDRLWETTRYPHDFDFPGEDGTVDTEQAREMFEEAGYSYVEGELVE